MKSRMLKIRRARKCLLLSCEEEAAGIWECCDKYHGMVLRQKRDEIRNGADADYCRISGLWGGNREITIAECLAYTKIN